MNESQPETLNTMNGSSMLRYWTLLLYIGVYVQYVTSTGYNHRYGVRNRHRQDSMAEKKIPMHNGGMVERKRTMKQTETVHTPYNNNKGMKYNTRTREEVSYEKDMSMTYGDKNNLRNKQPARWTSVGQGDMREYSREAVPYNRGPDRAENEHHRHPAHAYKRQYGPSPDSYKVQQRQRNVYWKPWQMTHGSVGRDGRYNPIVRTPYPSRHATSRYQTRYIPTTHTRNNINAYHHVNSPVIQASKVPYYLHNQYSPMDQYARMTPVPPVNYQRKEYRNQQQKKKSKETNIRSSKHMNNEVKGSPVRKNNQHHMMEEVQMVPMPRNSRRMKKGDMENVIVYEERITMEMENGKLKKMVKIINNSDPESAVRVIQPSRKEQRAYVLEQLTPKKTLQPQMSVMRNPQAQNEKEKSNGYAGAARTHQTKNIRWRPNHKLQSHRRHKQMLQRRNHNIKNPKTQISHINNKAKELTDKTVKIGNLAKMDGKQLFSVAQMMASPSRGKFNDMTNKEKKQTVSKMFGALHQMDRNSQLDNKHHSSVIMSSLGNTGIAFITIIGSLFLVLWGNTCITHSYISRVVFYCWLKTATILFGRGFTLNQTFCFMLIWE